MGMSRTVEITPRGPRPMISLRPVPACEPPFDDEADSTVWQSAHQLALDWSPTHQRLAPGDAPSDGPGAAPAAPAHRSVVAGASADAKLAVRRFVRLCVEVLNGYRPPAHLRRLSLPGEAAAVVAQALVGARWVADLRKQHPRHRPRRPSPVGVIKLRLCEPRPGAVEAAVALLIGERTWAMALRLELHHEAWSATALRLICC
jgi:hypothetical protein